MIEIIWFSIGIATAFGLTLLLLEMMRWVE
jgi:hypothetical protein